MLAEMVGFRMMDLENICDMVICCRPPAHVIKHSRKVLWFIHHERIFYDLWDSEYNPIPKTDYWKSFRNALFEMDTLAITEARFVYTNSKVVSDRLKLYNGIDAEVLYPPIDESTAIVSQAYGSELLFVCRIEHHKRQHLALEAMAHTETPVRLRVAGTTQDVKYLDSLHAIVKRGGLEDRVTIDARWISDGEKHHLLSHALAAVYVPVDEDSYGYPTLEAAHASRAVVSVTDAGGVGEFVVNGQCGLLTAPDSRALARAFDRLWADRELAAALGGAAKARIKEMDISWDNVVARLTA